MNKTVLTTAIVAALSASAGAAAMEESPPTDLVRVKVTIENLAPKRGTFLTPIWVGFHDGEFDTYDGNTPASNDPQPGSVAMERLCEDGDTMPITADFAALSAGVDATLFGPEIPPIAPGEYTAENFLLDPLDANTRYFSYATMIIPSNDFCISNGNPLAHLIFDEHGNLVAEDFFVTGVEVLDAGTEVNDEIPENTAFFGQMEGDTGVDENGNIGDVGELENFQGFMAAEEGGILADPRFAMADFTIPGYPIIKVSFTTAPAIIDEIKLASKLSGDQEVPPVATDAEGKAAYKLLDEGLRLAFDHRLTLKEEKIVAAHLHLGAAGENGPVVAFLFDDSNRDERLTEIDRNDYRTRLKGELTTKDLTGPLEGALLDDLVAEILAGNVYINIHTESNPDGEIRGQLK